VGCGVVEGGCSSIRASGKLAQPRPYCPPPTHTYTLAGPKPLMYIYVYYTERSVVAKPSLTEFSRVYAAADAGKLDDPPCVHSAHAHALIIIYFYAGDDGRTEPPEWHRFSRTTTLYYVCNVIICLYGVVGTRARCSGHHSGAVYDDVA